MNSVFCTYLLGPLLGVISDVGAKTSATDTIRYVWH